MKNRDSVFNTLDLLILKALSAGPKHGWALAKWFQDGQSGELLQINARSLYPALHRLEHRGWIRARWLKTGTNHGTAKFYFMTPAVWARHEDEMASSGHGQRSSSLPHEPSTKSWRASMVAFSAALGVGAASAVNAAPATRSATASKVCVCLNLNDLSAPIVLARAEDIASRILAAAGVFLEWHSYPSGPCRTLQKTKTVVLDFTRGSPSQSHAGALAYSKPFERLHAIVMYDRIAENARRPISIGILLGHVMAHEITHLLQGVELHSDRGLMKAHWDTRDISQMMYRPLPLTSEDIDLIQRGLAQRRSTGDDDDAADPESSSALRQSAPTIRRGP